MGFSLLLSSNNPKSSRMFLRWFRRVQYDTETLEGWDNQMQDIIDVSFIGSVHT